MAQFHIAPKLSYSQRFHCNSLPVH